jgi:hypothetical protein
MKPGTPPLQSTRLLDQLRERIRYMHYSLSTEKVYLYWVRFFIRWHGRNGQMKHPRTMGAPEIEVFLTMLATERKVSTSTHNLSSPVKSVASSVKWRPDGSATQAMSLVQCTATSSNPWRRPCLPNQD